MFKRLIASIICITFSFNNLQYVHAQDFSINQLPVPGTMIGESVPFAPLALKGLIVNPQKPLEFQFIVDTGKGPQDTASIKEEANQLVKYFLAGLTIPEGDLWVNLSPYEKNRMVPEALGQTDLGRDLLAQDYILKQLTASLIYPEKDLGKEFWSRVYAKAQQQFGTTNVPVNTFNKVWILPDQAQVYENVNAAYVTKSTLKVMLDEDYLALSKHQSQPGKSSSSVIARSPQGDEAISERTSKDTHSIASQIVRQIILPEIEKEVNTGKNFAPLRQIYQALILAKWYKETIQNGLLDAVYTNKNKVAGVNLNDPSVKEQIYERYLKAYKKGAFNYIKEEPIDGVIARSAFQRSASDEAISSRTTVARKYFSGGTFFGNIPVAEDYNPTDVHGDGAMVVLDIKLENTAIKSNVDKQTSIDAAMKGSDNDIPRLMVGITGNNYAPDMQIEFIKQLGEIRSVKAQNKLWELLLFRDEINNPIVIKQLAEILFKIGGERGNLIKTVMDELNFQIPDINPEYKDQKLYDHLRLAVLNRLNGYHFEYTPQGIRRGKPLEFNLSTDEGRQKHIEQAFRQENIDDIGQVIVSLAAPSLRLKYSLEFMDKADYTRNEFSSEHENSTEKTEKSLEAIVSKLDEKERSLLAQKAQAHIDVTYERAGALGLLSIIVPTMNDSLLLRQYLKMFFLYFEDESYYTARMSQRGISRILIKLNDLELAEIYLNKISESRQAYRGLMCMANILIGLKSDGLIEKYIPYFKKFFERENMEIKTEMIDILGNLGAVLTNNSPAKLDLFMTLFEYTHKRFYSPIPLNARKALKKMALSFDYQTRKKATQKVKESAWDDKNYVHYDFSVAQSLDMTPEAYVQWLDHAPKYLSNKEQTLYVLMGFTTIEREIIQVLNRQKENGLIDDTMFDDISIVDDDLGATVNFSDLPKDRIKNLLAEFMETVSPDLFRFNRSRLSFAIKIRELLFPEMLELAAKTDKPSQLMGNYILAFSSPSQADIAKAKKVGAILRSHKVDSKEDQLKSVERILQAIESEAIYQQEFDMVKAAPKEDAAMATRYKLPLWFKVLKIGLYSFIGYVAFNVYIGGLYIKPKAKWNGTVARLTFELRSAQQQIPNSTTKAITNLTATVKDADSSIAEFNSGSSLYEREWMPTIESIRSEAIRNIADLKGEPVLLSETVLPRDQNVNGMEVHQRIYILPGGKTNTVWAIKEQNSNGSGWHWHEFVPTKPDAAMKTNEAPIIQETKAPGGIDLNQINVLRNGKTVNIQFDRAQLTALEQGGFEGFTPVIINITRISSPFQLLGINPAKQPEVLAKV